MGSPDGVHSLAESDVTYEYQSVNNDDEEGQINHTLLHNLLSFPLGLSSSL